MEILHIIPSLETGGAQSLLAAMLPRMQLEQDMNVKVAVGRLTGSGNEQALRRGRVEIICLGVTLRSLRALPPLRRVMKGADIVHVHLFPAFYLVALASRGLGKPLFFTDHSTDNRRRHMPWLRPLERLAHRPFTRLLAVSHAGRRALARWLGMAPDTGRIAVVGNGIDLEKWQRGKSGHLPSPAPLLLMAARFSAAKDQATVIRAMTVLKKRGVRCVFAGDGPGRKAAGKLAHELGVEGCVEFAGDRNDVPQLAHTAAVAVVSSHWEGFGLAAVEMMAAGVPLVVSDIEGLAEAVGDAALRFAPGNHVELARCVERILDDPVLRGDLTVRGRRRAARFDIAATARTHSDLYREAAGEMRLP